MSDTAFQIATIARKDFSDAVRTKVFLAILLLMLSAGAVALLVAAQALQQEVLEYKESVAQLIELGRSASEIAPPSYYPLKLMRGFIEYVEILGAILGIVLGYRAAAGERGRNTLPLILTRPLAMRTFLLGKCAGNIMLLMVMLFLIFGFGALAMVSIGGASLSLDDMARLAISFGAAVLYTGLFFLLGLALSMPIRRGALAVLIAFSIWLLFVLIAPQIGDTLDPDNQIGSGVFRSLGIAKPQEKEILKSFASYENIRDGIEQSSPAKHFERWSFAVLGIKETYTEKPLSFVMKDRWNDIVWLIALFCIAAFAVFRFPPDFNKLNRE